MFYGETQKADASELVMRFVIVCRHQNGLAADVTVVAMVSGGVMCELLEVMCLQVCGSLADLQWPLRMVLKFVTDATLVLRYVRNGPAIEHKQTLRNMEL